MIIDTIDRIGLYASVLPYAKELGERFLAQSTDAAPCEIRQKAYNTRADAQRRFEVHAHTIDLMMGISGEEVIHLCRPDELTPAEPLPNGADGQKLDGSPRGHAVLLRPNCFVAIYPGEAHMVGGQVVPGEAQAIRKWVVKIPWDTPATR